jgi:hypothetical protein
MIYFYGHFLKAQNKEVTEGGLYEINSDIVFN